MPETSPHPDAPALRLHEVRRTLGRGAARTEVLRGVDLEARRGAVTVLLGPNGAGKSTTPVSYTHLTLPTICSV